MRNHLITVIADGWKAGRQDADYIEARLTRRHLQAKVKRLRDELTAALEQFQEAIEREDAMQRGHEN